MLPRCITDDETRFFLDNGYLVLRGALSSQELTHLRAAMDELTSYGSLEVRSDPDFFYGEGHRSGAKVLRRIEYVIDKPAVLRVDLGYKLRPLDNAISDEAPEAFRMSLVNEALEEQHRRRPSAISSRGRLIQAELAGHGSVSWRRNRARPESGFVVAVVPDVSDFGI